MIYSIHFVCWDIFLQNHAFLAKKNVFKPDLDALNRLLARQRLEKKNQRGLKPNWTNDYLGPENFWIDGWSYHEKLKASEIAEILDYIDEWDFLVHDPAVLPNVDELLENPSVYLGEQLFSLFSSTSNHLRDFFHMPVEILFLIFCFLSTASIQALRLANQRFATLRLNSTYWHSRFDYSNELSHLQLPPSLLLRRPQNNQIDWKAF